MFIDYSESEYAYILYADTMLVDAPWESKISNPLSFSAIAAICRALNRKISMKTKFKVFSCVFPGNFEVYQWSRSGCLKIRFGISS